ncbi:MAG: hypothetical protein V4754_08850 [Pseudomonadota bacterium]
MSRLHIDFAPPSLRRGLYRMSPAVWGVCLLGALLCLSAAVAGNRALEREQAREAQQRRLAQRQAVRAAAPAPVPALTIAPAQAAAVNAAVQQLNLPWRELQDAVAAATPPTVALLALEPDARKQVLKLSAEVKTSEQMIEYIQDLKEQEFFTGVVLTRHEINDQDPNKPIRFQLEAQWAAP